MPGPHWYCCMARTVLRLTSCLYPVSWHHWRAVPVTGDQSGPERAARCATIGPFPMTPTGRSSPVSLPLFTATWRSCEDVVDERFVQIKEVGAEVAPGGRASASVIAEFWQARPRPADRSTCEGTTAMSRSIAPELLAQVAAAGASDAGGLPVSLLGDFLPVVVGAVAAGEPLTRAQLQPYESFGDAAARRGVALPALLDLYSSAAWRLWRHLPPVVDAHADPTGVVAAGEVMLRAVDDVVAALAEGFQAAQRSLLRAQESARREFVDDLLTGGVGAVSVLQRASAFGLHLSGLHAVAVVQAARPFVDGTALIAALERAVLAGTGDAEALVASKEGRLIVVFPAPDRDAINAVIDRLTAALGLRSSADRWRIGLSRPTAGAEGVVASYQEARDSLSLGDRLGLADAVIDARELLVYHVVLRDRAAITDLVATVLTPLKDARGGAGPLLDTLAAYFAAGGNAAGAARALHLSVRAVTYRLDRVRELTGHDAVQPAERFALQVAVLGAQMLNWPNAPLD